MSRLSIALIVNIFVSVSLRAQVLSVPQTIQEHNQWCWGASAKCILDYYGHLNTQCEIAEYAWSRSDCCGDTNYNWTHPCNQPNYIFGGNGAVQDILSNFGNILTDGIPNSLSLAVLRVEINAGRPFAFLWNWTTGGGHILVCHGVLDNTVYYMDPGPGGGYSICDYDWMVGDGNHSWGSTLVLRPDGVEVNELSVSNSFLVMPNPGSGVFTFEPMTPAGEAAEIRVLSSLGEVVYSGAISVMEKQKQIDLSNFPGGIYYVKLNTESGSVSQKMIITK